MSKSDTSPVCADCGAAFEVAPSLRKRYPGWTPSRCSDCHRAHKQGATGAKTTGATPSLLDNPMKRDPSLDDSHSDGVFTDGSASPNPGPGGWGVVWVRDNEILAQDSGRDPDTTNNRMELTALLRAVELVPEGTAATLWTDSNLAVQTVNQWAANWKKRGWKRKRGPVENLDLVQPLYEALQARPELEVKWIKAHVGHRWNEYADQLASGN